MHWISQRELAKEPVRQKGCVKLALGVKYFSMVACWAVGGDWVRRWITWAISVGGFSIVGEADLRLWFGGGKKVWR